MKRLGIEFVIIIIIIIALGDCFLSPARGASPSPVRGGMAQVRMLEDGSVIVQTEVYRAMVGVDGNLHSLRVDETELLDDRIAISLGAFFYADGPRRLTSIKRFDQDTIEATDGIHRARYTFRGERVLIELANEGTRRASYFIVLSPELVLAERLDGREAAKTPANENWGDVRLIARSGAQLEVTGGTRIWGPWLGRQVWELSQVPAGEQREIHLFMGKGEAPRTTLEQLISLRAEVVGENILLPAGRPLEVYVSLENRSDQEVQATLAAELSACRGGLVVHQMAAVEAPPQRVADKVLRWEPSEPDFYTINVTAISEGREIGSTRIAGAYRASDIEPEVERPEGFREFWAEVTATARENPFFYHLQKDIQHSRHDIEVWAVQYESIGGKTLHGWYARPTGAHSIPAILYLSGYGARPIPPPVRLAGNGWAVLAIDVRGNRVDRVRAKPFDDYITLGIESPDTYVYREIIGHALRGLHFLQKRPEVDPARIGVLGVSEGGGVGIILAGLSSGVAAVAADAPLLVDIPVSLRLASWPYTEIARYLRENPASREQVMETLSYFDVVNFAENVDCPVLIGVGLLDPVSLPAAVYSLYNRLPEPREIRLFPKAGHEGGGEEHWTYKLAWLNETLAEKAP